LRHRAGVVDHDLDLLAEHAPLGVDLLGQHPERLGLRIAQEGGRPGHREDGADPDLVLRRSHARQAHGERTGQSDAENDTS
jgi:hypothetical protein